MSLGGGVVVKTGVVSADGPARGQVEIAAKKVMNQGALRGGEATSERELGEKDEALIALHRQRRAGAAPPGQERIITERRSARGEASSRSGAYEPTNVSSPRRSAYGNAHGKDTPAESTQVWVGH